LLRDNCPRWSSNKGRPAAALDNTAELEEAGVGIDFPALPWNQAPAGCASEPQELPPGGPWAEKLLVQAAMNIPRAEYSAPFAAGSLHI